MAKFPTLIVVPVLVSAACLSGRAEPGSPTGPEVVRQAAGGLDLTRVSDNALDAVPAAPVTPRFVLEHRSALNGQNVTVRGAVVRVIGPDSVSGGGGRTPSPGANPQPRVFLVESPARQDDVYELLVLLREGDSGFTVGQTVEVKGTVESGPGSVVLHRQYDN